MEQELTVPDDVREQIHFDTLWSQVQNVIQTYSGKLWTDRSEHDPGVTLLQALTFIAADVSYRHTLSLIDLLTPKELPKEPLKEPPKKPPVVETDDPEKEDSEWQQHDSLITPIFGPQRALTCGPVILDDYRCALLDLVVPESNGKKRFCLLDAKLEPEGPEQRYRYRYDPKSLKFRFPEQPDPSDYVLTGGYQLRLTRHPEVSQGDAATAVDDFLQQYRNLCETVPRVTGPKVSQSDPRVTWIEPERVPLQLVIDIDDDLTKEQAVSLAAEVVIKVEDWFNTPIERASARDLMEQGHEVDAIYRGPKLKHGWMMQLPAIDCQKSPKLDLRRLAIPLNTLEGVKRVRATLEDGNTEFTVPEGRYPLVWRKLGDDGDGSRDLDQLLNQGGGALQFRKRGQRFPITQGKSKEALGKFKEALDKLDHQTQQPDIHRELPEPIPYGRYRNPSRYRSAGSYLPPCYGLQQVWNETVKSTQDSRLPHATRDSARQLLLFLLPFEQWLANRCAQLARLPYVLSFDRREDPQPEKQEHSEKQEHAEGLAPRIWGDGQLPIYAARDGTDTLSPEDEPSRDNAQWVLSNKIDDLSECADAAARDNEKELKILDYLLGYFGEERADRTLLPRLSSSTDFRRVQQAYLRQITALTYDRAAISITKPSALQRRIAARLGVGPTLFSRKAFRNIPIKDVPFYLIEHRQLLPMAPAFADLRRDWQKIKNVDYDKQVKRLTLTLKTENGAERLQKGQLIDLKPEKDENKPIPLRANVVHEVCSTGTDYTVTIDLDQHKRLHGSARSIKADYESGKFWQWKLSPVWLERKVYDLMYQRPPHRTTASPLEKNIVQKQKVLWVENLPDDMLPGTEITLRKLDPKHPDLHEKAPSKKVKIVQIDPAAGCVLAQWEDSDDWPADQTYLWKWSVPYNQDPFESTLSVVLPRKWLDRDRVAEPMAVDRWVRGILADEIPSHLAFQLHWLDDTDFKAFGKSYQQWQQNDRPAGDLSYQLLDLLSIGHAPIDDRKGIGIGHILDEASPEELAMWCKPDNEEILKKALIFYVAKDQGVGIAHILDETSSEELAMWRKPDNEDILKKELVLYVAKDTAPQPE